MTRSDASTRDYNDDNELYGNDNANVLTIYYISSLYKSCSNEQQNREGGDAATRCEVASLNPVPPILSNSMIGRIKEHSAS